MRNLPDPIRLYEHIAEKPLARQRRIEFPGAFYHVISRGNRKQSIFYSEEDRYFFLNCLRIAAEKFGVKIHAYCLMENHYHLFLETPGGNLSRVMHAINAAYANYFNRKHESVGHSFQGRFKAILVQAEAYARDLLAYIHLNPVRAKITESPADYAWSNYREYVGLDKPWPWTSNELLRQFGHTLDSARRAFREFVEGRTGEGFRERIARAGEVGILGDEGYLERIRKEHIFGANLSPNRDLPQVNRLLDHPTVSLIISCAEEIFGPKNRYARKAAIYMCHHITDLRLKDLGQHFDLSLSGITETCRRVRNDMASNGTLARNLAELEALVKDRWLKQKK